MKLLNERDGLALGICNGFQALIKLRILCLTERSARRQQDSPTLTYNTIGRHISKMVYTKVVTNKSPWLAECRTWQSLLQPGIPRRGTLRSYRRNGLDKLFANGQVATQYVNLKQEFRPWTKNGMSTVPTCAIEGITSPDGRVLGKMAHSERETDNRVAVNIYGEQDMKIFESGVAYFK